MLYNMLWYNSERNHYHSLHDYKALMYNTTWMICALIFNGKSFKFFEGMVRIFWAHMYSGYKCY